MDKEKKRYKIKRRRKICVTRKRNRVWKIKNKKSKHQKVINHLNNKLFELENKEFIIEEDSISVALPKVFSISEKPNEVIGLLRNIYWIIKHENLKTIQFDYTKCEKLGLSANVIMDIIISAILEERKGKKNPIEVMQIIEKNFDVNDILYISEWQKEIKLDMEMPFNKIKPFQMISGDCESKEKRSDCVATKMIEYFDECFKIQGMEINFQGKNRLSKILGEVIDNCEIHGGRDSTWYVQGYYKIIENESDGEIQLVFFSLGNTIYESLRDHSSEKTKGRLKCMLKKHEKNISETWTEEMIYTVFSLQQGASRLYEKLEGHSARGSGTVSLIEQMNAISEKDIKGRIAKMTIISGKTYIDFSGLYKMESIQFNQDPVFGTGYKKIIAFNEDNDIYKQADSNNVKLLEASFPGTVISLKFHLNSEYIQKIQQAG